jgi:hypothetical protein
MSIFRHFLKPKPLELHALEPNETWYERCYWLMLLVKELKAERDQLREQNKALLQQVNAGEPLSFTEEEFLAMRQELNEMHKAKAKLDARVSRVMQVNQSLIDEVDDLRIGYVRAA